ncbi:hypothetical protein M3201_09215 [Paenibacillus motobuensis]|uniref:hypothetical protein n=1 Tax=Paenibacillus TaxID=44249 RepID=UPI00203F52EC|nr:MULTISPECIES: hypothetical protein [Paenibacillus]MCM3039873.1 hypothetical protein [Paenibacillus lutimineralis]MCM3646977.1 hypothetical protein [Paenibacillus motobuensis]
MRSKKYFLLVAMLLALMVLLSGCVPGDGTYTAQNQAGFFWGIWHGWVALISLVIGLFNHDIRIYEINNSGWWYDLGYYLAVISGFGGISLFRKKK